MQKEEVERKHSSFVSSRNAVAALSWSCGRCVSIASSGLEGETGKSGLFFFSSYTLLKPSAICSEARDAFPRLNCQSNAKYIGALLLISLLRGFVWGFLF